MQRPTPPQGKGTREKFNAPLLFRGQKMASRFILLNSGSSKERKESRQRKDNVGKNTLSPHTGHPLRQKPDACVCVNTWNRGVGANWIRGLEDETSPHCQGTPRSNAISVFYSRPGSPAAETSPCSSAPAAAGPRGSCWTQLRSERRRWSAWPRPQPALLQPGEERERR